MSASPPLVFADIDLTLCIFFALFLPQETAIDKIGRISSEVDSLLEDLSVSEPRTDEERSVSDQLQAMVQELREKTNSAKLTCLGDPEGLTKLREDIGKEVAEAAAATVRTDVLDTRRVFAFACVCVCRSCVPSVWPGRCHVLPG